MIEIQPIQTHQTTAVKNLIIAVCTEIFQVDEGIVRKYDDFQDIDNFQTHYLSNQGIFLVVTDNNKVVGCGGVRYLSEEICELKRMWFLSDYRGRGLGRKIAQILLEFATQAGYKQIRLDVFNAQKQTAAIKLYQKLGFYPLEKYNSSPCTLFMEKVI